MKKSVGPHEGRWVPPDRRGKVVDCITSLRTRTDLPVRPMLARLGIARSKYAVAQHGHENS